MPQIETFSHIGYKTPHHEVKMCEDRLIINKSQQIYGVFDGATSASHVEINGLTDGAYIAAFFKEQIEQGDFTNQTAAEILAQTNQAFGEHLASQHPKVHQLGKNGPSGSVVLVKLQGDGIATYAQVGDCMLIEQTTQNHWHEWTVDSRYDDDLKYLKIAEQLAQKRGCGILDVRQEPEVMAAIKAHRAMSNVQKGVATGELAMNDFIHQGRIDLQNTQSLIMMSDGMADPDYDLKNTYIEAAKYMKMHSIEGYYNNLRDRFEQDIDWHKLKYIRGKHIDDASAMILNF